MDNIMDIPVIDVGALRAELEKYKRVLGMACEYVEYEEDTMPLDAAYFLKKAGE